MRAVYTVIVLGACACSTAPAQEPKFQPKFAGPVFAKADPPAPVPGRTLKKIEGFTFLISEEALNAGAAKYAPAPLEVLALECKRLTARLSPKALEPLYRMTVFVNWDEKAPGGRDGPPVASYYSGNAQQAAKKGLHPLQARSVTIHALKALTEMHQPNNERDAICVLLHEFAHAVHDQHFGFDHAGIKAAYEQAIERRLIDRDSYAATNAREFFAEMSCAYLDRLNYYPHNRTDLKKNDPITYKTLEGLWAGAEPRAVADEKPDLSVTFPADVRFGPHLAGPEVTADKLAGQFVLIGFWTPYSTSALDRLDRLRAELGGYGVAVVSACAVVEKDEAIKARGAERAPHVSALRSAFVRAGQVGQSLSGGDAILFDPAGKCVFRGSVYNVDEALRAVVGKALLRTVVGAGEVPVAFKPIADAFASGVAPVAVVPKLAPLVVAPDGGTRERAQKLQDLILAPGQKALAAARAKALTDPVEAYFVAEQVATGFKHTSVETRANELLGALRTKAAVADELTARGLAGEIERLATKLRVRDGSADPSDPAFREKYQLPLNQLQAQLDQLRRSYPNARATAAAERAARELGVK